MVDHDTNSTQCSRSCSCSYTSLIYSELLTDEEIIPVSPPKREIMETKDPIQSPKCTCPPVSRPKLAPVASEARALPLSMTTCLPLPLPPTPVRYYREPDYFSMERNFFSSFDGRPFMPLEPQRVCYMTRSPKNIGELFTAEYNKVWHLVKYDLQRAEYMKPNDPKHTPFQSVVYLKGERQGEGIPVTKEVAKVVDLNEIAPVKEPPGLLTKEVAKVVDLKKTAPVEEPPGLLTKEVAKVVDLNEIAPVEEPPRLRHVVALTPRKDCSLETFSNDCSSIYRVMGSSVTSRSFESRMTNSSRSLLLTGDDPHNPNNPSNSADELVKLWDEFYGKDITDELSKKGNSVKKLSKKSSSVKKSTKESSALKKSTKESSALKKPTKESSALKKSTKESSSQKKSTKENRSLKKSNKESSSWEKSLSEEGAYRSSSDECFPPGTKKYLTPDEARFLEWEKEIGRLREFLGIKETGVKKGQKTAGGEKTKAKKRTTHKKK